MTDPLRKRLLEKTFRYVKSGETDVSKTFARIRRQMKEAEAAKPVHSVNVAPIKRVAAQKGK
jgi:hypothetical protein